MTNDHLLNTSWALWYHIPNDKNWSKDSYKKIIDIKTIEDYWCIHNNLKPKKTILTNLHHDLDYDILFKKLPKNVVPAYDGMKINL